MASLSLAADFSALRASSRGVVVGIGAGCVEATARIVRIYASSWVEHVLRASRETGSAFFEASRASINDI